MFRATKPAGDIKVFISYAHKDEELRIELDKHLTSLKRQGIIATWQDREILPGDEWAGEIDQQLNTAQIILLLISSDFLHSDFCYSHEMQQAVSRHEAKEARVIPIILRSVEWRDTPFGKLQALPKDAKPVTSWEDRDEAYADVARGIKAAIEVLIQEIPLSRSKQSKFISNLTIHKDQWAARFRELIEAAQNQIDILQTYVPIIEAINEPLLTERKDRGKDL